MSWYKTGTITVNNGSAAVTGSGTAWVANAAAGEAIYLPDGKFYEIASVNSDTSLTLASNYTGTSLAGQSYTILPSQSFIRDLAAQAAALINSYASIANNAGAGKFGDGTLGAPGISFVNDTNTGIRRTADGTFTLVSNGVDVATIGPGGMVLVTPNIGAATGTSLALSGAITAGAATLSGSVDLNKASGLPNLGFRTANVYQAYLEGISGGGLKILTGPGLVNASYEFGPLGLVVAGASGITVSNGPNGKLTMGSATYYGTIEHEASVTGSNIYNVAAASGGGHRFQIGGTDKMIISASGKLTLGTSTPSGSGGGSQLTVEGTTECAVFKNSGGASYSPTVMWNAVTTGDPYFAYFITENTSYPGTNRGSIDFNRVGGLVRYNTTSDITLKTRLGPAPQSKSIGILESTVLEEYFWNDDETKKPQIGPFAQDLYKTFKGAVSVGGMRDVMEDVIEEVFEDVEEDVIENLIGDITEPVFADAFNAEGEKIGVVQTGERVVGQGVIGTVKVGTRIVNKKVGEKVVGQRKIGEEYLPWGVDKTAYTFHLVAGFQHHQQRIAELEARLAALEGV